ncbi:17934_t:CDS:1, partial [Cetraspora pellucida]
AAQFFNIVSDSFTKTATATTNSYGVSNTFSNKPKSVVTGGFPVLSLHNRLNQ